MGRLGRRHRSQKQELNPWFHAVRCASTAQQCGPCSAQHSLHRRHCSLSSHQPHQWARAGKTHLAEDKRIVSQLAQSRNRLLNSSQLPGSVATSVLSSPAWESLTFQWNTLCLNGCSYCTAGPLQWNPKRGVKGPEQFQGVFSWFLLVGHPQFRSRLVAHYLVTGTPGTSRGVRQWAFTDTEPVPGERPCLKCAGHTSHLHLLGCRIRSDECNCPGYVGFTSLFITPKLSSM